MWVIKISSKHKTLHMREYHHSQQEPFYYHGLSLIQVPVGNYTHYKMRDIITYPFPTANYLTAQQLRFDKGQSMRQLMRLDCM